MVRLRTNRWYSTENQKTLRREAPSNSSGSRRVVSLLFLLALVLLLMQRVSDPENVSRVFRALGVPINEAVVTNSGADPQKSTDIPLIDGPTLLPGVSSVNQKAAFTPWQSTCNDLIARLLDVHSSSRIAWIAQRWFSGLQANDLVAGDEAPTADDLSCRSTLDQMRQRMDLSDPAVQQWDGLLSRFTQQWDLWVEELVEQRPTASATRSNEPAEQRDLQLDADFLASMENYLDRRLLNQLRDASPWTGEESVGFGRLLQRADRYRFENQDPPAVSSSQLDAEFDTWRGRWVRLRGTVRRLDQVARQQPLVSQSGYQILWLRLADGGTQPVAVYTTQDLSSQLQPAIEASQFPEVDLVGLVGKRLAYASASGVQVAPTVFAASIVQMVSAYGSPAEAGNQGSLNNLVLWGAVAFLSSLLLLVPVWRQTFGQRGRRNLFWLLAALTGLAAGATEVAAQALPNGQTPTVQKFIAQQRPGQPPWADSSTSDQLKRDYLKQRLEPMFENITGQALAAAVDDSIMPPPESLLRAIVALQQVGWTELWNSESLVSLNSELALKPLWVEGLIQSIREVSLSEEQQEWFSVASRKSVFILTVQLDSSVQTTSNLLSVLCIDVPELWRQAQGIRQPIQLRSFAVLSRQRPSADGQSPAQALDGKLWCAVAERPGWIVGDRYTAELEQMLPVIPSAWRNLALGGWDLAWFDLLRSRSKQSLDSTELPALVKMLELSSRESSVAVSVIEPLKILGQPDSYLGHDVDWTVRLVSCTEVTLDRASLEAGLIQSSAKLESLQATQSHQGLTYYQFDGFVRLPKNQTIEFRAGEVQDPKQRLTFREEFPVTILTTQPSPFLSAQQLAAGKTAGSGMTFASPRRWQIGKLASVQGKFFRLWSYQAARLREANSENDRLIAPLIVASRMQETMLNPPMNRQGVWVLYLVGVGIVVASSVVMQLRFARQRAYKKSKTVVKSENQ